MTEQDQKLKEAADYTLVAANVNVIREAPDAIIPATVSITLGAAGAVSSVETVLLFTMEEAVTATKAGQVWRNYKPPTAA